MGRKKKKKKKAKKNINAASTIAQSHLANNRKKALAFLNQGDLDSASRIFHNNIHISPEDSDSYFHLGNIARRNHREQEAIAFYKKSLENEPHNAACQNNLGNVYQATGDFSNALQCYKKAVQISPSFAEAFNNMGNSYKSLDRPEEAISSYRRAIEVKPDCADSYNNIGYTLQRLGQLSEAKDYLLKALNINPNLSEGYNNLGNIYKLLGRFNLAVDQYRKALCLKPDFNEARSNISFCLNYIPGVAPSVMLNEAEEWWELHGKRLPRTFKHVRSATIKQRLRIGYVSGDFKLHSVSFFLLSFLAAHDRKKVETFCYSDVQIQDEITQNIIDNIDHWCSCVGMDDAAVAQKIYTDKIDILVDLAGHTAGNRLLTFARKPAPISVSWLGYPNTTGMKVIDYRLTDNFADPQGMGDTGYSEQLYRLPNSFLCYTPVTGISQENRLAVQEPKHITFGSFNNPTKVNKEVIALWAEILQQVPGAKLLLKSPLFSDAEVCENFFTSFEKHGISKDRIILRERTRLFLDHLAMYNKIDIALDPFPYNGTTTTCEAMWMGVPVITLKGDVHAARVGTSILSNVGVPELIAASKEEYLGKAVALAHDIPRLTKLHLELRGQFQNSTLCNAKKFSQDMEEAYQNMWRNWYDRKISSIPTAEQYNAQGENYYNQRQMDKAIDCFQEAVSANNQYVSAYNNLGALFFHLGDYVRAEENFIRAISLDRQHVEALSNLSQQYFIQERFSEAEPLLEEVVKLDPTNASLWFELGMCQEYAKKYSKMVYSLQRSSDLEQLDSKLAQEKILELEKNPPRSFKLSPKIKLLSSSRILVVTNLYPPQELGGYGRLLHDFTSILRGRNHSTYVLTSDSAYLGEADPCEDDVDRRLTLFGSWEAGKAVGVDSQEETHRILAENQGVLLSVLEIFKPDICLVGNIDFLSHTILQTLLAHGIPVIQHVGNENPGYPVQATPSNNLYHLAAASSWLKNKIVAQGYPLQDISVVYPGAFVHEFRMSIIPAQDKLRIVFASIVLPYKGPQVLIDALKILDSNGVDFFCSIAGTSTNKAFVQQIKDFVVSSGMQEKISFRGCLSRKELKNLYATHNILAFPSVFQEPFGISQVEAMAAGLTVISSGTGGAKEIVENGKSGIVFESNNPVSLAKAFMDLYHDSRSWQKISRHGQQRALQLFDIEKSVDQLEKKFAQMME